MGGRKGAGRLVGLVLAGGAAFTLAAGPSLAAGFTLDGSVTEATGLAGDTLRKVYWTAARTQGAATALGPDGRVAGAITYGATPVDVQAVSVRDGRLWIGDIGDPSATRRSVVAYRIAQPSYGHRAAYRSFTLAYADGSHDARAMVVSPRGRLYVVTRGANPGIYRSSATLTPGGATNTLTRVGAAPDNVTDATFSADGSKLVLRTLTSVHVLDPYSFAPTAAAELPAGAQGEALTTALDGSGLVVTGAGTPVPVERVAQPTTLASVAPAPATPSATPTPSTGPSAQGNPASAATRSRGSVLSLVAAGVIAVAAAAVVVLKR